jgi:glucose-1-phosphate adenylyltransferase
VPRERAKSFGVMDVDEDGRVRGFMEKPAEPPPVPGNPDASLASMGIYIFNTRFLFERLIQDADSPKSSHDFGKDIIPYCVDRYRVYSYPFSDVQSERQGYWRDVGTVDSYWEANLELTGVEPELNLYDTEWPIWTYQEQLPPAKFVFADEDRTGHAVDSLVSGGCIISGSKVQDSLLFSNVRVNSYSEVQESVILPDVEIGRNCKLRRVVIDRRCRLPDDTVIGYDLEEDRKRYHVTENGIVLVTAEMIGQSYHYVR